MQKLLQVSDINWEIVGTGDFNNDGKVDILWRNKSTGQNIVWFMNGTVYISYAELYQVTDTNWEIVGTGDFNSDGKVDILWRNKSTGQNIVWFMNGTVYISYAELLQVTDTNWEIVGTGDFNNDGKVDILWRNKSTGQNIFWFMNGAVYSSYAELPQVTDTNWKIVGVLTSTTPTPQQYTLTISVSPSGAGTVSVNGQPYTAPLSFNSGTSVALSASPASGYTFSYWSEGASQISTFNPYIFTINANRNIVANFLSSMPLSWNTITLCTIPAGTEKVYIAKVDADNWVMLELSIFGRTDETEATFTWAFPDGTVFPTPATGVGTIRGVEVGGGFALEVAKCQLSKYQL